MMKAPITRRIENIRRDTYQPQRLGYPVFLASRPPKAHWLARDILFGTSALIVISAALGIYHLITK